MLTGPYALLIKIGGSIAIVLALWGALMFYGHVREQRGVDKTDQKWEEAGRLLEEQVREASAGADVGSAGRVALQQKKLQEEKELLDEADAAGTSPFDVLFNP